MGPQQTTDLPHPWFLYGTAWKEEQTRQLTELALQQGFRGIDTANQRKHYYEAAVGEAIENTIASGLVTREELFIQTKFTFQAGQDHRLPYDPSAPIATQVEQSFASSLEHLRIDYLDSLLLHGPSQRFGLGNHDYEAWSAMEAIQERGGTRMIGVSNVTLEQLDELCRNAHVLPRFVQNRCFAINGWDRDVRAFCNEHGIIYQGFSLLTANHHLLNRRELLHIAAQHQRTVSQIIFRFAIQIGMLPLTGTTSVQHMQEDLAVFTFELTPDQLLHIEQILG